MPPPDYETRAHAGRVELRAAPDGASGPGTLTGYGAVFDSPSRDLGGFVEVIERSAFGDAGDDGLLDITMHVRVMARGNHKSEYLLGTTDAGTLRLYVDDAGLRYEIDLPDTSYGRDFAVLAERGDIRFSSFAFRTLPEGDDWRYGANDELVRYVTRAQLVDVAPVADPAYWGTTSELHRAFDLDAIRASISAEAPSTELTHNPMSILARAADIDATFTTYAGRNRHA